MPEPLAVAALQSKVDFSRFLPGELAPSWVHSMAALAKANAGALALIGPPGVSVAADAGYRKRADLEPTAVYLAALADCAAKNRTNLAFGCPANGQHLPLLLAVGAVLSTAINRSGLDKPADRPGPVLVVSPDLDLRSRYCDIFIKDVSLDAAYAGSRLVASGVRQPLKSKANGASPEGVCFFLPNLTLPATIGFRPQLVILDLRFSKWSRRLQELLPWAVALNSPVVAIHTLGDIDTEQAVSARGFQRFALDYAALSALATRSTPASDGISTDWSIESATEFLAREHHIHEIPDSIEVESTLLKCIDLLDKARNADPTDLGRAHWIIATLRQLPVPIMWYEDAARNLGRSTIRRLISQIGFRSNRSTDLGPVLQTVRMELEALYARLQDVHPRADFLRSQLSTLSSAFGSERILCVTRDKVNHNALRSWLDLEAFPVGDPAHNVRVQAAPSYKHLNVGDFDCVLVNGAFPRRYRWIVGDALAPKVVFIAYQREVDVVASQIQHFYDKDVAAARLEERLKAVQRLTGSGRGNAGDLILPTLHLEKPRRAARQAKNVVVSGTSLNDLGALMRDVEKKAEERRIQEPDVAKLEDLLDEEPPAESEEEARSTNADSIRCIRVQVDSRAHGRGYLYLPSEVTVECVKPSAPERIVKVLPMSLAPGDVMPRVDEHGRTTLFETIVEMLDEQPHMRPAIAGRRQWQLAVERLIERYKRPTPQNLYRETLQSLDYTGLLADLRRAGTTVETEQAVRGWITGETIGPDSVASIKAVGKVSGVDAVTNNSAQLDRAFRKIRGLHQDIGRRLASAIRRSFIAFAESSSEPASEELDEHLALPLAELLESMDFAEVVTNTREVVAVSPNMVGQFMKA